MAEKRPRGRPRKDAAGWHALSPEPQPPPTLPDYSSSASWLALPAPLSSPPLPSSTTPPPQIAAAPTVATAVPEAVHARHAAVLADAAPPATLAATRTRAAPPAVSRKRSQLEFDRDAAYETYMQERHRVQKRVHESHRLARDRSARTRPAREKQQAATAAAAAAAAVQAPLPDAAVAPELVTPELLNVVRSVWQHLGWLDTRKLFQMVGLHGMAGTCAHNPWLQALPAELRNDEQCLVRLLPLARRRVKRERDAAGLSVRSRAQTKRNVRKGR